MYVCCFFFFFFFFKKKKKKKKSGGNEKKIKKKKKKNFLFFNYLYIYYSLVYSIQVILNRIKLWGYYLDAASSRAGIPAELKHIIKRRKKN